MIRRLRVRPFFPQSAAQILRFLVPIFLAFRPVRSFADAAGVTVILWQARSSGRLPRGLASNKRSWPRGPLPWVIDVRRGCVVNLASPRLGKFLSGRMSRWQHERPI